MYALEMHFLGQPGREQPTWHRSIRDQGARYRDEGSWVSQLGNELAFGVV